MCRRSGDTEKNFNKAIIPFSRINIYNHLNISISPSKKKNLEYNFAMCQTLQKNTHKKNKSFALKKKRPQIQKKM
jgi:hypothetical protein